MTVRELITKLEMLHGASEVYIDGHGELSSVVQLNGEQVVLLDDSEG